MHRYARSHLSDPSLLQSAAANVRRERTSTADLLADLAEIDTRQLYLPAAYPSLHAYCVGVLHLCEQAAYKRILAARAARRFPGIFEAVAEGRLHLSGVVLLAAHLTEHTAEGLLSAATHKSKSEIEQLLAERFPKSDLLAWVASIPSPSPEPATPTGAPASCQLSPGIVQNGTGASRWSERPTAKPLSSQSFGVQFTLSGTDHDKLVYAQELLSHQIPSGDIAEVFVRALDALIPQLEKAKFAATGKPRAVRSSPRHIPDARAAEEQAHEMEVVPYLHALGCNARESRDLAAHCRDMRDASLEERVRVALSHIHVRGTKKVPAPAWAQAVVPTSVAAGP